MSDDVFPDFLACRATAVLDGDRPFLIWELKREDSGKAGEAQIKKYGKWAEEYRNWMEVEKGRKVVLVYLVLIEKNEVPFPVPTHSWPGLVTSLRR